MPTTQEPAPQEATPELGTGGVRVDSVTLSARGRCLIRDLSVTVERGETLAVMGRSGVGKSTLLRAIAGIIEPDGGEIIRPPGPLAMVFQDPRLLPWRSALDNVQVVLGTRAEHRATALSWLDRVGLADAADVYPGALSGGMRQRVSIARALAVGAPLVLVDEPFSNLDVTTANELRTELGDHLRATGSAVLWVTHNPLEAIAVAPRTLVVHGPPDGRWQIRESTHRTTAPQPAPELTNWSTR